MKAFYLGEIEKVATKKKFKKVFVIDTSSKKECSTPLLSKSGTPLLEATE